MSIVINSPQFVSLCRRDSATSATPLVPSLDPAGYVYNSPALPGGRDVKAALDELFRLTTPPPFAGEHWQKFTTSGEFVVPDGVNRLLILCIGPGRTGNGSGTTGNMVSNGGPGGGLISAFLETSPGSRYLITTGGSFIGKSAVATEGGEALLSVAQSMIATGALAASTLVALQAATGTAGTHNGGRGGGGFAVSATTDDEERKAWQEIALNGLEVSPSNHMCRPDATKEAPDPGTSDKGGSGAAYGGGGGGPRLGYNTSAYRGQGGAGLVAIFW